MKHLPLLALCISCTLSAANTNQSNPQANETIQKAIQHVEDARSQTVSTLQKMIHTVKKARSSSTSKDIGVATHIIETHALSEIANSTANVEIAKAKSISLITQAINNLDSNSLSIIAEAIAAVEVAKATAIENIVKVTGRVEISKTKESPNLKYPQETLTIAKNLAAIQIAKAVTKTDMQRAISRVEVAKATIQIDDENTTDTISQASLENIKATATANISSYLAQIEVVKANMISKISEEIAKVEIAKLSTSSNTTKHTNAYPKTLIKVN